MCLGGRLHHTGFKLLACLWSRGWRSVCFQFVLTSLPLTRLHLSPCPSVLCTQVRTMFTTIVNPDAAGFKSIRTGIISALAAHLLYGRAALSADGSAGSALMTLLGRVGAAPLQEDVADLGQKLAGVAAVCEAVHGDVLALLAARTAAAQ